MLLDGCKLRLQLRTMLSHKWYTDLCLLIPQIQISYLHYTHIFTFIFCFIVPYIEDPNVVFFSDYKSALQEYIQTEQKTLFYDLVDEYGPAHEKTFVVEVRIDDIIYGKGIARSKKEAEQNAAKDALRKKANV